MLIKKGTAIINRDLVSEISAAIAAVVVAFEIADILEEKRWAISAALRGSLPTNPCFQPSAISDRLDKCHASTKSSPSVCC